MREAFNVIILFLALLAIVSNIYFSFDLKDYHSLFGWVLSLLLFIALVLK